MYSDYELFVAIVEEGSLTQAARSLNLSRPVVTKRLQRLEDKLGVMLLHRTTRRVVTTREGQSFYDGIKPVILAAKMAESNIAALKHPQSDRRLRGEIKIRTVNSIARNLLGPVLFSFSRMHPDVRINVLVFDQPIDLLSDKVDAEITFAPPSWQGAILETLALDRRILCASPSYLAEQGTPGNIEDLHGHAIVASPISMPWRLKGPGETSFFFHGKTALLTNSSELPGFLAMAGMGIALRPVWAMMHELRDGRLVRVLPEYESDSYWAIRVATSTDRPKTPALQAFLAHLKEEFSGLDAQVEMELASLGHKRPE